MNAKTLEALKGSIKKWEAIMEGGLDEGAKNCPLCELFSPVCNGCPVDEITVYGCVDSPYTKWTTHHYNYHPHSVVWWRYIQCPACRELAQKELDFLKSLLPVI